MNPQWLTLAFLIFNAIIGAVFIVDRWVHRMDADKQDITNQLAGRPSVAARLTAIEEGQRDYRRTSEKSLDERFAYSEKERQRLETSLDERWSEGVRALESVRARLHIVENWRQEFGAKIEEKMIQNDKEHSRFIRQLDARWTHHKEDKSENS